MDVNDVRIGDAFPDLSKKPGRPEDPVAIGESIGNVRVVMDLDSIDLTRFVSVDVFEPRRSTAVGREDLHAVAASYKSAGELVCAARLSAVLPRGIEVRDDERDVHASSFIQLAIVSAI